MAKNCDKCKFCDFDYEFDEYVGEEVEIHYCRKNLDEFLHDDVECACFKKRIVRKYVEQYSKCDFCDDRSGCDLLETTSSEDTMRHYISEIGNKCKKE